MAALTGIRPAMCDSIEQFGCDPSREIVSARSTIKNAVDSVGIEYFTRASKVLVFDKKAEAQAVTARLTHLIRDLQ